MARSLDIHRRPPEIGTVSDVDGQACNVQGADPDETATPAPLLQQYGMTSRPLDPDNDGAAEGVIVYRHGRTDGPVVICADDSRYRIALENGEVALYSHTGAVVHLRANGDITVEAPNTVRLGTETAPHPVTRGDRNSDLHRMLLSLLSTMAPVGNMGVLVPFSSDLSGTNGTVGGGITIVKTAMEMAGTGPIDQSESDKVFTE